MIAILCLAVLADAPELVRDGNDLFRSEQYEAAEAKYLDARIDAGESPIIAFNLGNVFLAREDYAKARDNYQEALQSRDPILEAKIKYNMGHTYFGEAETGLEDLSDPEKVTHTTELLRQAIRRWRDVLKLDPDHEKARQNIIVATRVLKDYLDRVKRFQEQQRKEQEEQKGQNLAEILQDLLKRQEEEKTRTDGIIVIEKELEPLRPIEARYTEVSEALQKALAGEGIGEALGRVRKEIAAILADPAVVEGATSIQQVEKALGGPEPRGADAQASMTKAIEQVHGEVAQREEAAGAEHTTGKQNQTRLNVETQRVVQGIDAQLSGQAGGLQAIGPPSPQPGQQPPAQPPPMPPQKKQLFEDVKALVEEAVTHQTDALKHLELGGLVLPELAAAATEQEGAADKLREALERLQEEQEKQNQQNKDQQQNQDQQKDDQEKQKQQGEKKQERKSLSRQEAEEIVRRIKEKEQQKKREKRRQLLKAVGRRGAKYDW